MNSFVFWILQFFLLCHKSALTQTPKEASPDVFLA